MNIKRVISSVVIASVLSCGIFFSRTVTAEAAVLYVGSSGSQVSALQSELKVLGYFTNPGITGYYGQITSDSVKRFQSAYGLTADGIAGPITLSKLSQVISPYLYTVKSGDTLWLISVRYGTSVDKLKSLNSLYSDTIYPGQALYVKTAQAAAYTASNVTEDRNPDLYWLSRIIEAEATGEPYIGKVAVGNVIINRVNSSEFPNTIKSVIFEYDNGLPQFSPVADGTIYNTPSQDSINAAIDAMNGSRPVGNAMFFFNPAKSSGSWIVNNKTYVTTIADHVFYQ